MKQNTEHTYCGPKGVRSLSGLCLLLAALLLSFASCSDDEEVTKSALGTTTIVEGVKTVSTIAFSWSAVEGATQYAYELTNEADDVVLGGMTAATSLLATGLDPETTYTLSVWSYAALGSDKTTSPIATLTATTNAVEQLDKPASVDCTNTNGSFVLTWPAVEDAQYYLVFFDVPEESLADVSLASTVDEPTYTLRNVEVGEHTVYVFAMNDDENFSMSEGIKLTFTKTKSEVWRKECNYYSAGLDRNFTCQIVSYDDGSYTVEGIYGSSQNLEFSVDAETSEIIVNNAFSVSGGYYYVSAGDDYILSIYTAYGYSEATISRQQGEIWFYNYLSDPDYINYYGEDNYDYITWGSEVE